MHIICQWHEPNLPNAYNSDNVFEKSENRRDILKKASLIMPACTEHTWVAWSVASEIQHYLLWQNWLEPLAFPSRNLRRASRQANDALGLRGDFVKYTFALDSWRNLGWKNSFWELLRFYCSLRGTEKKKFLNELSGTKNEDARWWDLLGLTDDAAKLIVTYCAQRETLLEKALDSLRTEQEAKAYCSKNRIKWTVTRTKSNDHHQSSKTLIATVSSIAMKTCGDFAETVEPNPQKRCVWLVDNHLHVTARNLDGAVPSLKDPYIVWEIKEYWGKTKGGSKMSDAVYECQLVGREIREYEERSKHKITHAVFLDGKDQWHARRSDLARFIDLHNQGLIDHLFIGRTIETEWEPVLRKLIAARKDC